MLRVLGIIVMLLVSCVHMAHATEADSLQDKQDKAKIVRALLDGDKGRAFDRDPMLPPIYNTDSAINAAAAPTTPVRVSAPVAAGEKRGLFEVSLKDAEAAISQALVEQGAAEFTSATLLKPRSAVLYRAATPITLQVATLQFDTKQHNWSGNILMTYEGQVVSAMPASGRWQEMQQIPVLTRSMRQNEVITEADIADDVYPMHRMPANSITSRDELIGKSPRRIISPNRPIRISEVQAPQLVAKDATVTMHFSSSGMEITAVGVTMEAGAKDQLIRVKNADSSTIIQAKVISATDVRVGNDPAQTVTTPETQAIVTPPAPSRPVPVSASFPPPPPPPAASMNQPQEVMIQTPQPQPEPPAQSAPMTQQDAQTPTTAPQPATTTQPQAPSTATPQASPPTHLAPAPTSGSYQMQMPEQSKSHFGATNRLKMSAPTRSALEFGSTELQPTDPNNEAASLLKELPTFSSGTSTDDAATAEGTTP